MARAAEHVYDTTSVPVAGGSLQVGRWRAADPAAPVLLAVHGVTANHRCWAEVAAASGCTVVAPDLRGRGRSGSLPGPAGMSRHAADLVRVLDHLEVPRAVLVGHSMGGFVVAALAELEPSRAVGVLLVDGGLPLPPPPAEMTPEQVLAAVIGPAAQRLAMTFPTRESYLDYWRPHPALAEHWSPQVEDYLLYDLDGDHSSVSVDAVRDDSVDLLDTDAVAARVRALPGATTFLGAPYGLMAEPGGLYPPELMAAHAEAFPQLRLCDVPDANHYTILFDPGHAATVAAAADELAGLRTEVHP
jgi:pimeloyl-ACP methyl ester carboxylesterase